MANLPIPRTILCLILGTCPFITFAKTDDEAVQEYINKVTGGYTTQDKVEQLMQTYREIVLPFTKMLYIIQYHKDYATLELSKKNIDIVKNKNNQQIESYIANKDAKTLQNEMVAKLKLKYSKKVLLDQEKTDKRIDSIRHGAIQEQLSLYLSNYVKQIVKKDVDELRKEAVKELKSVKKHIDDENKDLESDDFIIYEDTISKISTTRNKKEMIEECFKKCFEGNLTLQKLLSDSVKTMFFMVTMNLFIMHVAGDKTINQLLMHLYNGEGFASRVGGLHKKVTKYSISEILSKPNTQEQGETAAKRSIALEEENAPFLRLTTILQKEHGLVPFPIVWTNEELKSIQETLRKDFSSFTSNQKVKDFLSTSQGIKRQLQFMAIIGDIFSQWTVKDLLDSLYTPFKETEKSSQKEPYLPTWHYVAIPVVFTSGLLVVAWWRKKSQQQKRR
ncbi:MAG: hypothetical protein AAF335_02210 [Bacteroidota bacterium]